MLAGVFGWESQRVFLARRGNDGCEGKAYDPVKGIVALFGCFEVVVE